MRAQSTLTLITNVMATKNCLNAQCIGNIRLSLKVNIQHGTKQKRGGSVAPKKAHKAVKADKKHLDCKKPCPGGTCD